MSNEFETAVLARLDAIEARLAPATPTAVSIWIRPAPGLPRYGLGKRMSAPDVGEAIQRALSGVLWNGDLARAEGDEEIVWAEVETLKGGLWEDIKPYAMLNEDFCYFGLLTGVFQITAADALSFGTTARQRERWAGYTIQGFLDEQFGTGTPSGG